MSALVAVTGWLVALWALGALTVMLVVQPPRGSEWLALAAWPVTVPLFATWRRWRRWRYTCSACGGFYGNREHYERHRASCPRRTETSR